ncbi:MAG: hypothetical protein AB3N64_03165 [Puniceicoccaceae bacterium]
MKQSSHDKIRLYFTLLVAFMVWCLLIWQHFNGGVPKHYILHRADMPAISNWWGGILLPVLSWILVGQVVRRGSGKVRSSAICAFCCALLYGIVLSASFIYQFEPLTSLMAPALLFLALFFPIYRGEYVLGFILGMSYTFGAVLPTAFAIVVGLLSAAIYHFIRPIPFWLWRKLRQPEPGQDG